MNPAIMLINVVLPQPDGPTMARNSPRCTSKFTSRRAMSRVFCRLFSYPALTPRMSISGGWVVGASSALGRGRWVTDGTA
jgi:hypothetical protein